MFHGSVRIASMVAVLAFSSASFSQITNSKNKSKAAKVKTIFGFDLSSNYETFIKSNIEKIDSGCEELNQHEGQYTHKHYFCRMKDGSQFTFASKNGKAPFKIQNVMFMIVEEMSPARLAALLQNKLGFSITEKDLYRGGKIPFHLGHISISTYGKHKGETIKSIFYQSDFTMKQVRQDFKDNNGGAE